MGLPRGSLAAVAFGIALASSAPGAAQPRPSLDTAVAALNGTTPEQVRTGIETLGLIGSARAVEPLAARIRRGLPPELLELAVDTLTVLRRAEAGPVLFELATHRRPEVRLKAIEAIVACRPRGADEILGTSLGDGDARVRAAAALALGQLGARGTMDALFLAFDRGVPEASTALGQIAQPADVTRLLRYLGRVPFDLLAPALTEILARRDVTDRSKLEVVAQLQELATAGVKNFLRELSSSLPAETSPAVRRAVDDAVARIAD